VDKVHVSTPEQVKKINVYNMQGALLKSAINSTEISLQEFTTGVYILEVTTLDGKAIYRIIKQ